MIADPASKVRLRRGLRPWLGLLLVLAGSGCEKSETTPRLEAVRFLDEKTLDGRPEPGETILLTFSRAVFLDSEVAYRGVHLDPPRHSLGRYSLRRGPEDRENQLRVVLGEFDVDFEPAGIYGDPGAPDATGLALDFDGLAALSDRDGQPLTGLAEPLDIARTHHPPARLLTAEWIDQDRGYTINSGDHLRLTFDRPVRLAEDVKKRNVRIPEGTFIMPVDGDRLDDGDDSAYLREDRQDPATIWLVFGNNPHLTTKGSFSAASSSVPGTPSGIAIQGTEIRPQMGIVDSLGQGVVSEGVIDISGDYEPFREIPGFLEPEHTIYGHSVTSLPDGRILVTGGVIVSVDERGRLKETAPQATVWLFDPAASSQHWTQIGSLKFPRIGHTATLMPGPDLTPDTEDDLVVVAGGFNGQRPLNAIEYIQLEAGIVAPLFNLHPQPSSRFYHTAHALPDSNELLLVGGQDEVTLNGSIERISIKIGSQESSVVRVGELVSPRFMHESVLYERGGPPVVLVWGGVGFPSARKRNPANMPPSGLNSEVLAAPELIHLDQRRPPTVQLEPVADGPLPSPRRGHRLLTLDEERFDLLLVGGTPQHPHPGFLNPMIRPPTPQQCQTAYRIQLDLTTEVPTIEYRPAGQLNTPRFNFGVSSLPFGKLLIVGGNDGRGAMGSVELFDPATDAFQVFSEGLIAARESPTVTPIAGTGRWLVIGGLGAVVREGATMRTVLVEEYQWKD